MEMIGSQRMDAPREEVYRALNDVALLRQCIPGCNTIERIADDRMKATVTIKVGPLKVAFAGDVTLSDLDPPRGYTITGAGSGGVAGFAKGSASVSLEPDGSGTMLHYVVKADIGGKLAQLGSRLIQGTAERLSADFFARLGAIVGSMPLTGL